MYGTCSAPIVGGLLVSGESGWAAAGGVRGGGFIAFGGVRGRPLGVDGFLGAEPGGGAAGAEPSSGLPLGVPRGVDGLPRGVPIGDIGGLPEKRYHKTETYIKKLV